jgi:predicted esterase
LGGLIAVGAVLGISACTDNPVELLESASDAGRLDARPHRAHGGAAPTGFETFGGGHGLLYVPEQYRQLRPVPLVLALPGAGGNMRGAVLRLIPYADRTGAILLGVRQHGATWDYIAGAYGRDISFIDAALRDVLDRYAVDPARVGVLGFSDGATYALSIGITNGDLFRHVVAFSPGFADTDDPHGSPAFFITHGTEDRALPIEQTSRTIVPELRQMAYEVDYREFSGGHDIPNKLVPVALKWLKADR